MVQKRISLDTSDFTVERQPNGRILVYMTGSSTDVEIDLDPDVAMDLVVQLLNPDDPEQ